MSWTILHGLDDDDIPADFADEWAASRMSEGDIAMALNALLLAGWLPPSRARARAVPKGVPYANPCGRHFQTRGGWWGHCVLTTPHSDEECEAPEDGPVALVKWPADVL